MLKIGTFLFLLLLMITSCAEKNTPLNGYDYREINFFQEKKDFEINFVSLPLNKRPNRNAKESFVIADTSYLKDADGIFLFERNGKKYYHPVGMCHKAVAFMTLFEMTQNEKYLFKVKKYASRLLEEADLIHGALHAPWYSGMAQGEILSLFVRLFEATSDSLYLNSADKIFASFLLERGDSQPWTVFTDDKGCYWIEEYPTEQPSMTLNGFIFSLYGVYDYYQLTKSEEAKEVFKRSVNTIKNYISYFRRERMVSFYGLTFRHDTNVYHYVHIQQLQMLAKMTGDNFFNTIAGLLQNDFNKEKEKQLAID